jgi:UDP-N-acetylmuramyl pentapeptide phosphotransferase/UDP-N-acetylglucosamine-1-phosphate transferase
MCTVKQALGNQDMQVLFWPAQMAFGPQNWGKSEEGVTSVLTELSKTVYYTFAHSTPMWNCWQGDANILILLGLWLTSGLASFAIIFGLRCWASHHLLDIPNERSSHKMPTPRGGGLGIVLMTLLPFGVWLLASREFSPEVALLFIVTSGLIAAVGWIDDHRSLSARGRLALHFLAAGLLVAVSGAITRLDIPLLGAATLGTGIGFLISLFWIAGFTNAYNFMDGIDGLAGVQAVIAGLAWCLLLLLEGQGTLALLAGTVAAASLGFLLMNAPPALIFMGDVGSTFLGFTLAAVPVLAYHQTENPRLFITGVLLVAPFVFDSALTLLRRILKQENIFTSHRSHLYQRLVRRNYSHWQVTGLYTVLCGISALCGLLYYAGSDQMGVLATAIVVALCLLLTAGVTRVELRGIARDVAIDEVTLVGQSES